MEMWKESHLKQLTFVREIEAAYPILQRFAENIGFDFCGVNFTTNNRTVDFNALQINNYPQTFNHLYEKNHYSKVDPVISHCNHSVLPIVWSKEVYSQTPDLWHAQQSHGLKHGWSQSFIDEQTGLCSIVSLSRPQRPLSPLELYEHFGFMFYAINHLHDLFSSTVPIPPAKPAKPRLSPRELEVLELSAVGKTAYEISRILCLSERTVNYHVQNVIIKLKVCNKISAVIAAARIGII